MNATTPLTILDRLTAEIRAKFEELGRRGRGPLGRLQTQAIVDDNIHLIRRLLKFGTYADLAAVLIAVGITTKGGAPLSAATLSSAISRTKDEARLPQAATRRAARAAGPTRPTIEKACADFGGSSLLRPSSAARGPDTGAAFANRGKAISPAPRDPGIAREDDPRAAIFALLGDANEEE